MAGGVSSSAPGHACAPCTRGASPTQRTPRLLADVDAEAPLQRDSESQWSQAGDSNHDDAVDGETNIWALG